MHSSTLRCLLLINICECMCIIEIIFVAVCVSRCAASVQFSSVQLLSRVRLFVTP